MQPIMSRPCPEGMAALKHEALLRICATWKSDQARKKVMTLSNEVIDILTDVGYARKQLLPNASVGSLVKYIIIPLRVFCCFTGTV